VVQHLVEGVPDLDQVLLIFDDMVDVASWPWTNGIDATRRAWSIVASLFLDSCDTTFPVRVGLIGRSLDP